MNTGTLTQLYDELLDEAHALAQATSEEGSGASRAVRARATSVLSAAGLRRTAIDAELRDASAERVTAPEVRPLVPTTAEVMQVILDGHRQS